MFHKHMSGEIPFSRKTLLQEERSVRMFENVRFDLMAPYGHVFIVSEV